MAELVDHVLDLSGIYADYTEARGYPPYDPRLMVRLLVYGYTTGMRSSRGIQRRCADDVGFRYLAAGQAPDFRWIAKFRRRHLDALAGLFLQSLRLATQMGLVKMGRVALDGTKLRANASRHEAMSYDRLVEREPVLAAEVDRLRTLIAEMFADAEATDVTEDARFGADGRQADLPGELARRETRLAKMRAAKHDLEAEAADRARAAAVARARHRDAGADPRPDAHPGQDEDHDGGDDAGVEVAVRVAGDRAAAAARPKPRAQRNFTDPESRIMKSADGAFVQAYNAQAVVDDAHQIIIAADLDNCAADSPKLTPMLDLAQANTGRATAGPGRRRLLLSSQPGRRRRPADRTRHPDVDRHRPAAPRRGAPGASRADPERRHPHTTDGPRLAHQTRPGRLRPAQGHRGTGVWTDRHLPRPCCQIRVHAALVKILCRCVVRVLSGGFPVSQAS